MRVDRVSYKTIALKDSLKYAGKVLLTYKIEYPQFSSLKYEGCVKRVNRFYARKALELKRYCETKLFGEAVTQYKDDIANNYPVRVFDVVQVFEVTYMRGCALSLYTDRYEYTGGAHGITPRTSQTWNLQKCGTISLPRLVPCPPDYKTYILSHVEAQIRQEPQLYFEKYGELIAKTFDKNSFYCTTEGIVVYYQQYDIAPYASGIREFLIPYGGCVIDPLSLCDFKR